LRQQDGEPRRRFGISIPESMAAALDKLAAIMNTSRSSIIEQALRSFVKNQTHYMKAHTCSGLLVLSSDTGELKNTVSGILEEYSDVILSSSHYHVAGRCIEVILVHGSSERIVELEMKLRGEGCIIHFLPLSQEPLIEENQI